jgi:hypothetical protein
MCLSSSVSKFEGVLGSKSSRLKFVLNVVRVEGVLPRVRLDSV